MAMKKCKTCDDPIDEKEIYAIIGQNYYHYRPVCMGTLANEAHEARHPDGTVTLVNVVSQRHTGPNQSER